LFGALLEHAVIERGAMTSSGLYVPDPVFRCVNEIIERALDSIIHTVDLSTYDIHAIAGVMKKYLRSLPEPVIPTTHHHRFLTRSTDIHALADLVTTLPRAHFHLLYYMIQLASHIQQYQHINMMNPEALAVVLAPVCTGLDHRLKDIPSSVAFSKTKKSPAAALDQFVQANARWTQIWTLMIQHHQLLLDRWSSEASSPSMDEHQVSPHHTFMVAPPQHRRSPTPPSLPTDQQQQRKRPKSYGVVVMRRRKRYPPSQKSTSMDDLDHFLNDSRPALSMLHMTKENSYDRRRRTRSMVNPKIPPLV
ncbi:Rho GTPase activation protein, partial [Fennellomyces sp. T-0311]